jgi:hypothetical protein
VNIFNLNFIGKRKLIINQQQRRCSITQEILTSVAQSKEEKERRSTKKGIICENNFIANIFFLM